MGKRTWFATMLIAAWTIACAPAFAQAPQPKTTPLTIPEARAMMGYPERNRHHLLGGLSDSKVAILDTGFDGLDAWLKANPKEAALTKIITAQKPGTHGFDVYRIARQVLGDAEIFLYDWNAFNIQDPSATTAVIADMKGRGVQIVNASFGNLAFPFNRNIPEVNQIIGPLINAITEAELFVFFSSGNSADDVHSFAAKAAGFEYRVPELMVAPEGGNGTPNMIPIRPRSGKIVADFYWDTSVAKDPPFQIQAHRKNGESFALVTGMGNEQILTTFDGQSEKVEKKEALLFGSLRLALSGLGAEEVLISIRKRIGGSQDMPMRLFVQQGLVLRPLNGRESVTVYPTFESPFTVSIGAIGRGSDGKGVPTYFSSWGTTRDGQTVPHIFGPGQFTIDGKVTQGTSLAAPFVTSMLVLANGYNPKNILERVSDFERLSPSVPADQRSRWGMPSLEKLFPVHLKRIIGQTKAEDWSHRVDDKGLHLNATFTRCCMEGMTYHPTIELLRLRDADNGKMTEERIIDPVTKRVVYAQLTRRSKSKDIVKEPLSFTIPKASLPTEPGRYRIRFGFFTKAWKSSMPTPPEQGYQYDLALN